MKKFSRNALILLAAGSAASGKEVQTDPLWKLFTDWKAKYNMSFANKEEDAHRFRLFVGNMERATYLTKKSGGKALFGPTKFSHLSPVEFKETYLGYKPSKNAAELKKQLKKKIFKKTSSTTTTPSVDWRELGAVSPVKDQGQCGSCWAFSATEAAESGYFKNTGQMKILSPQQVTSCDSIDGGCQGGDTITAYDYMRKAGGMEQEIDYPYKSGTTERTGRCKAKRSEFAVQIGETTIISQDAKGEADMLQEIQHSPMSICVEATSWQLYMGGVVDSSTCGTELDHCVQLAGYRGEEDDYWIVKNSWAANWGEQGYIYVKQGQNACGVAMEATIVDAYDENYSRKKESTTFPVPPPSVKESILIMEGVAKGMGIKMADTCVSASENVGEKMDEAYILMQNHTAMNMAKALRLVAGALKVDLPQALAACETSKKELAQLIKALAIMEHPKEFYYHVKDDLKLNGVSIYREINASVGLYKQKQWKDMGEAIGKALEMILIGTPEEQTVQDLYV